MVPTYMVIGTSEGQFLNQVDPIVSEQTFFPSIYYENSLL